MSRRHARFSARQRHQAPASCGREVLIASRGPAVHHDGSPYDAALNHEQPAARTMNTQEVTMLVERAQAGDTMASEVLLPIVYDELRRLAASELSRESPGHTLQATALVNEAYLRLIGSDIKWQGRKPFFCAAATAIRRILVDHARTKNAAKRGGGARKEQFDEAMAPAPAGQVQNVDSGLESLEANDGMLQIHRSLERLEEYDARQAEVVLLRYFGGLTIEQTAAALGVSAATVKNDWAFARAWLRRDLTRSASMDPS